MHPSYVSKLLDYEKWRLTYEGGRSFIEKYLKQYNGREGTDDFTNRKEITYAPAHAKSAINEVKNSIFSRIADVVRTGGSPSYQRCMTGQDFGVDYRGSSMSAFVGRQILPELLPMQSVGVFVDRTPIPENATLANKLPHPYLYRYRAEDISNWNYDSDGNFSAVELRDRIYKVENGLPLHPIERIRQFWIENGVVNFKITSTDSEYNDEGTLALPVIPFVLFELSDSLLTDVADYQIALLNIESSDIAYILNSNFPFYTEQGDAKTTTHIKKNPDAVDDAGKEKIEVGSMHGRRYPKGTERPDFIAPPTEPLMASMAKQNQIKDDIRRLIHLSVSNLQARATSAESKGMDDRGLEAGLSYIGLELELGEKRLGEIWSMYENASPPTIAYPKRYSLKSDQQRLDEVEALDKLKTKVPSTIYSKEVSKSMVDTLLEHRVPPDVILKIKNEIDSATILTTDPDIVLKSQEQGILSDASSAKALGYPPEEAAQAAIDHAAKLARIAESQSLAAEPTAGGKTNTNSTKADRNAEKKNSQNSVTNKNKRVRGDGE